MALQYLRHQKNCRIIIAHAVAEVMKGTHGAACLKTLIKHMAYHFYKQLLQYIFLCFIIRQVVCHGKIEQCFIEFAQSHNVIIYQGVLLSSKYLIGFAEPLKEERYTFEATIGIFCDTVCIHFGLQHMQRFCFFPFQQILPHPFFNLIDIADFCRSGIYHRKVELFKPRFMQDKPVICGTPVDEGGLHVGCVMSCILHRR